MQGTTGDFSSEELCSFSDQGWEVWRRKRSHGIVRWWREVVLPLAVTKCQECLFRTRVWIPCSPYSLSISIPLYLFVF